MAGDPEKAEVLAGKAWAIDLPAPDPMGDVRLGVLHQDVLLHDGARPEAVERAAARALDSVRRWNLDTFSTVVLSTNLAYAFRIAGQIDRAARIVDPPTDGAVTRRRAFLHSERVLLDVARGRLDAAVARMAELDRVDRHLSLGARWEVEEMVAWSDVWTGRPQRALDRLTRA